MVQKHSPVLNIGINRMCPLKPLSYPIYFVQKNLHRWPELSQGQELPEDLYPLLKRCVEGSDIWAAQTYILLKQQGLNVRITPKIVPGQICFVPSYDLAIKDLPFNSYIVACRLDSARPEICEEQTVLNKMCVHGNMDHFIIQWPQTYLKPRNSERTSTLKNLAFKGTLNNLAQPFRDPSFKEQLSQLGITLQTGPDLAKEFLYDYWRDYTDVDAVLAVRLMAQNDFKLKPPIKLINSWFAGCPALLGPEPAYLDLKKSDLDFFEIRSSQDAITALRKLKEEPGLYQAMVENGLERSKEFTQDQIVLSWYGMLNNSIIPRYERWKRKSPPEKLLSRPIKFIFRAIRHKQEWNKYYDLQRDSIKVYGLNSNEI